MLMKQLLLCFWAYVSCQRVNSSAIQLKTPSEKQSKRSLSDNGGTAVTLPPHPRFLPRLMALGVSL